MSNGREHLLCLEVRELYRSLAALQRAFADLLAKPEKEPVGVLAWVNRRKKVARRSGKPGQLPTFARIDPILFLNRFSGLHVHRGKSEAMQERPPPSMRGSAQAL